ncbi:MAG: DNA methyltransferase, partial [Pseudomonadota bacterium]
VTGLDVPDDAVRVPVENYVNPRAAEWPAADFVIGNPPFIGNKRMRIALGDGYVEALRGAWPKVPETADLVMYWWEHAAELTRTGMLRRFGLITTNSLRQTFNRKVIERHLGEKPPLSLVFAVPDHPWVDSADGAAVRIAMTAGAATDELGTFTSVDRESPGAEGENTVVLASPRRGEIHADLTVGAKVGSAQRLIANAGLCFQGMNLVGKGFRLTPAEVQQLGYQLDALPEVIKPHRNARDMMQGGEDCFVIDLFGFSAEQARDQHPALYQWLHDRVKPERDHNNRAGYRDRWWMFGEARGRLRAAWSGLPRVILTPETSKHRLFEFQALPFCPDHSIYAICLGDTSILGVLSSRIHALWSLRAGSTLEDRPRWRNLMCFDPFAFPDGSAEQRARIATLAEQIDAHRKRQQAKHPDLTLTGVYNVLEKLRTGESLSAKEKAIHDHGLVSVLRELHDGLDRAVFGAYGWNDLAAELVGKPGATTPLPDKPAAQAAAEEELLSRLVKLNAERAAEEARGLVRWLRPEYQAAQSTATQTEITEEEVASVPAAVPIKRV